MIFHIHHMCNLSFFQEHFCGAVLNGFFVQSFYHMCYIYKLFSPHTYKFKFFWVPDHRFGCSRQCRTWFWLSSFLFSFWFIIFGHNVSNFHISKCQTTFEKVNICFSIATFSSMVETKFSADLISAFGPFLWDKKNLNIFHFWLEIHYTYYATTYLTKKARRTR